MEVKSAGSESLTRRCAKCHTQEATLDSRSQPVCRDCFTKFIATKCIKQIGILGKETRPPPPPSGGPPTGTRRYLLGLSLGVSSAVLLHLLNENVEFQLAKGRNAPFDLVVVHITTTPSPEIETALARFRTRYPRFTFLSAPLPSLPLSSSSSQTPQSSTAASRSDITRLLTRRALLSAAATYGCQALLLGHSTTALAELTLTEAAKGRGFALPWLTHDGPVPSSSIPGEDAEGEKGNGDGLLVYHPLRDALRKELVIYADLMGLGDLIGAGVEREGERKGAVVNHRDLSIEEVMGRYFAEVEESYPSVVANVARTTGKLVRLGGGEEAAGGRCGLCRMPLDEAGDERWRGELGLGTERERGNMEGEGKVCYGCERSTVG